MLQAQNILSHCQGKPKRVYRSLQRSINISLSILEPVIFLPDYSKYSPSCSPPRYDEYSTCSSCNIVASQPMIRGSILLKLSKLTNIKRISLLFYGVSETQWPYYGPLDTGHNGGAYMSKDRVSINGQEWHFVPSDQVSAEIYRANTGPGQPTTITTTDIYGADAILLRERGIVQTKTDSIIYHNLFSHTIPGASVPLLEPNQKIPKDSAEQSGDHQKETLYPAGEYVFNFTIAIGRSIPETVVTQFGSIKYYLEPKVIDGGSLFGHTRSGREEVELVRCPKSNIDNPIVNNSCRVWENYDNRLHYDIELSSVCLSLGDYISIAISYRPLCEDVVVGEITVQLLQYIRYTNSFTNKNCSRTQLVRLARQKYSNPKPKTCPSLTPASDDFSDLESGGSNASTISNSIGPSITTPLEMKDCIVNSSVLLGSQTAILTPYSNCSPYIQVKHNLTITFKISSPHPKNAGLRKQEDIQVHIPIQLLSEKCAKENLILPQYQPSTNQVLTLG